MKKLLVVVDYQNDFVGGSLGFEAAKDLEDPIVDRILEYENNGDDVVFTLDTHFSNYMETEEGKYLPVPHCIKGTIGHELYGEVRLLAMNHIRFEKETFPSKELLEYLLKNSYDEISLCGIVTNICVISNAIISKAACPNAHIIVLKDLVASNDSKLEEASFITMESLQIELK